MRNRTFTRTNLVLGLIIFFIGCKKPPYNQILPLSSDLGSPRGYRIARIITHLHSPYSYDACDQEGLIDGKPNSTCLTHLRDALCKNRIDFAFFSDHPDNQSFHSIQELLLAREGDILLYKNGRPYANQLPSCQGGVTPILMTGFESKLMALGMERHFPGSGSDLNSLYASDTVDFRSKLDSYSNALVVIPHTESRTLKQIEAIQPDAIEIYNIHANLDPKIRKQWLGTPAFGTVANILTYIIDPYNKLNPDFIFLGFFELSSIYAHTWNQLIQDDYRITGLIGTDAHENFLSQILSDGERIDSFRRILRFVSNHFLVTSMDPDAAKAAIRRGRGWAVFEGFGSPQDMDFFATTTGQTIGVGDSGQISDSAVITLKTPSLSSETSQGPESPDIRAVIKRVIAGGDSEVVATSEGGPISYTTTTTGAYRAEISIRPKHIREFLDTFSDLADQYYPWIITNHIYLDP